MALRRIVRYVIHLHNNNMELVQGLAVATSLGSPVTECVHLFSLDMIACTRM